MDEIYEDELEPVKPAQPETIQTATSEAHELLRKEIAAATADVPVKQEESVQTKPDAGDIHMEPVSGKTEVIVPQVKEQLKQMMKCFGQKTGRSRGNRRKRTGRNQANGNSDMVGSTDCRDSQKSGRCAGYCERRCYKGYII